MMRPAGWSPPVELSPAEQQIVKGVRKAKLFVILRLRRHELFTEDFQTELATLYVDTPKGQPPVPPAQLAVALIMQAYTQASDDEVIEATLDRRLLERTVELAATPAAGRQLRTAWDSSPLWGAGRVEDT